MAITIGLALHPGGWVHFGIAQQRSGIPAGHLQAPRKTAPILLFLVQVVGSPSRDRWIRRREDINFGIRLLPANTATEQAFTSGR